MALNQEYPLLNGIAPSWADIGVKITPDGGNVIQTIDIQALTYGSTLEVGEQRGASGGRVLKRTAGALSHEASMTLYRSGHKHLLRALVTNAPRRGKQRAVGLVPFDVHVQFTPLNTEEIFEFLIRGARMIGDSGNSTEGTDAEVIEVPLSVIEIVQLVDGEEIVLL